MCELKIIEGLCISWINQSLTYGDNGDRKAELTLLKQSHDAVSHNGYRSLMGRIAKIIARIND